MIYKKVLNYLDLLKKDDGYASVKGGVKTLYGTCYSLQIRLYLEGRYEIDDSIRNFILNCQDPSTGYFLGPELQDDAFSGLKHDKEHILLHLLCTVIPVLIDFDIQPNYEFREAKKFLRKEYLNQWLNKRDWSDAWLEGNNLLFVGELLAYFRDIEKNKDAADALNIWYNWLEKEIDPKTGLWGTNGYCNSFVAMCGGYHQLLLYYYYKKQLPYTNKLIDTVLKLQHFDGGFSPSGGGGACEDIDAVDILVNLYKITNYKKLEIRFALKRCLKHIISLQNEDGGFPYKKGIFQSHMGIPATVAGIDESTMFATWFRVHTIALISEVLLNEEILKSREFYFNSFVSMGWHRKWNKDSKTTNKLSPVADSLIYLKMMIRMECRKRYMLLKKVVKKALS